MARARTELPGPAREITSSPAGRIRYGRLSPPSRCHSNQPFTGMTQRWWSKIISFVRELQRANGIY